MRPNDDAEPDYIAAAEKVAGAIEGTCDALYAVLERMDFEGFDDNAQFCDALDARVFECTCCGWWFEVSMTGNDVNGQWACVECGGEIEG